MATSVMRESADTSARSTDLLLHPELLSKDFMQLILSEKNIRAGEGESHDRLTSLYLRHVIPLPQRPLPNTRWGQRMERSRQSPALSQSHRSTEDHHRKRPLIVFDGASHHSNPLKVKKTDLSAAPTAAGCTDRMQTSNLKRESDSSGVLESPEMKKKIHHVKWP
ncbi:hypothetical protein NHX12_007569 [Muraenolepis orangiensis]|uniref:Ashwin n=1 Tax=Muraenolepis orangiensis TaxID=630683 RepID=A0A9Q0DTP5_9TELE|nr:hypothetical protein NHX12_007569 [Muraenolepis orangiensis]